MKKVFASLVLFGALFNLAPRAQARPAVCSQFEKLWSDEAALDAASDEQIDLWVRNYNKWC